MLNMCGYMQVKLRKLMIPASHAGNTGSIPVGTTKRKSRSLDDSRGLFCWVEIFIPHTISHKKHPCHAVENCRAFGQDQCCQRPTPSRHINPAIKYLSF